MKKVQPHQLFHLDFDQILEEGRRQELIDQDNVGEYAVVQSLHSFLDNDVLPLIVTNDWVYEAASIFATRYANDCFHNLRLTGQEVYRTQRKLMGFKDLITEFLARAKLSGAASLEGVDKVPKISDFLDYVEVDRLGRKARTLALKLADEARDHEYLQLRVVLRGIRDGYETAFTRVMFVARRAMKVKLKRGASKSDRALQKPSSYIDWLESNTIPAHILNQLFVQNKEFYRVARNVGNHHHGLQWLPQQDVVVLPDMKMDLPVHIDEFHRYYRYLIHYCELGLRGILAAFCERERGELSNQLARDYNRTFPREWDQGEKGILDFYVLSDPKGRHVDSEE